MNENTKQQKFAKHVYACMNKCECVQKNELRINERTEEGNTKEKQMQKTKTIRSSLSRSNAFVLYLFRLSMFFLQRS